MYKFKGYDWTELAECWGITVEEQPINIKGLDDDPDFNIKEKIDVSHRINGMKVTFEINNEEEVLAEKIKQYIQSHLHSMIKDEPMGRKIGNDLREFIKVLVKESKKIDYNYPVFEGMLKVKDDFTLAKWVCDNLERMWT